MNGRARTILTGVAILLVIGVVLGVGVGWLGAKLLNSTGLHNASPPPFELPSSSTTPSATPPTTTPTTGHPHKRHHQSAGSGSVLNAAPKHVGVMGRIYLTGTFARVPQGVTLQVQSKQTGTWSDFPVTLTTGPGGSFSTYVQSGQSGPNQFRISLPGTNKTTPAVTVNVG
ncbi:MAG: hypothetical protein ACRDP1_12765 [Nocardioidaceae bacterium]